jgi:hypothetical protein
MRRIVIGLMVIGLGAVPLTAVAAGQKSRHFTDHLLGALVQTRGSSSTYVYEVSSKQFGQGAGVLVGKSTSSTAGTSRGVIYFASGSVRSVTTYRIAPEPNGVLRVTSTGHDTGLSGVFKGLHGSVHATGSQDPNTHIVTLTATGTLGP